MLRRELEDIDEFTVLADGDAERLHSNYCVSVILDDATAPIRFEIISKLKSFGVGTSIYYPSAVPHMTYYKQKYGTPDGAYPTASRISNQSIALPVGPHLDGDDMSYMAKMLKIAIKESTG